MKLFTKDRVIGLAVVGLLLAFALHRALADPPPGPQGEVRRAAEDAITAGVIASAVEMIEGAQVSGDMRRRGHAAPGTAPRPGDDLVDERLVDVDARRGGSEPGCRRQSDGPLRRAFCRRSGRRFRRQRERPSGLRPEGYR